MAHNRAMLIWTDVNGFTRLTTLNNDGDITDILLDLEAKSNASATSRSNGPVDIFAPLTANATYNSVLDSALLSFENGSGGITKLLLPAPKLSIFAADRQTVDPAQIATLIADVLAHGLDSDGNALVSYLGGFYARTGRALTGGS